MSDSLRAPAAPDFTARDVLAVQGPETLEMAYIENWCSIDGTSQRLSAILASLPPI